MRLKYFLRDHSLIVISVCFFSSSSLLSDSNALPEQNTRNLPEVWDDEDGEVEPHQDPKKEMTTTSLILLKFMVVFLLAWQAIFWISNMAMDIIFKFLLHKLGDFAESAKLKLLAEAAMLKAHMLHAINSNNYQHLVVV